MDRMERVSITLRALGQRGALGALLLLSIAMLALARTDSVVAERIRVAVHDLTAPPLAALSQSLTGFRRARAAVDHYLNAVEENARLRAEIGRLRAWEAAARRLEQEAAAYRTLLNVQLDTPPTFVTARVIAASGGPFVRAVVLNAGLRSGLQREQAVVDGEGLVGRVATVGQRAARVLLITDLNSRVPVRLERSRHRAILAGDNSPRPMLEFLPPAAQVAPGDRVVTSGDGGVLPPDLPVGIVSTVADGVARVQPLADLDRLEFVRVLRFVAPVEIGPHLPELPTAATAPGPDRVAVKEGP